MWTLRLLLAFILAAALPTLAWAEQVTQTTDQPITGANSCAAGNDLDIEFNVTAGGTVLDVNLGLLAAHTWRGDMNVRLEAPNGDTVQLINPVVTGAGNIDDYNILLDDDGAPTVNTGTHASPDGGGPVPPYENEVAPNNPLSDFNGIIAAGTWSLLICDAFPGADNGTFQQADLYVATSDEIDLSFAMTADTLTPDVNSPVTFDLTVANAGPAGASGITVNTPLPAGFTFQSDVDFGGQYDETTGIWTIPGTLAAGADVTISITAIVNTAGPYIFSGEIASDDQTDQDSTPSNNIVSEDDQDSVTITPTQPPQPPDLSCPAAEQIPFNWDAPGGPNGWAAGSLVNGYSIDTIPMNIAVTGDTGFLIPRNGIQTPVTDDEFTGGQAAQQSLVLYANFAAQTQSLTLTINLGAPGQGVDSIQFNIFDVDAGAWIDRITVTGTLGGTSVTPTLIGSGQNTVIGNQIIGSSTAPATSGGGNASVTFADPVDQIILTYDNDPAVGANPGAQVMSFFADLAVCPALAADLSAVKSVELANPTGPNLYMTPGNEIVYKITITNSASATADASAIDISDTLPPTLSFVSATTTGFTGGTFDNPPLPTANTNCGSSPCIISFEGASLPTDSSGEILVTARIN